LFIVDETNWLGIPDTGGSYMLLSTETDGTSQARGETIPFHDLPTRDNELNEALCKRNSAYLLELLSCTLYTLQVKFCSMFI